MTTPYVRQSRDLDPRAHGRQSAAARREELSEAYRQLERSALHDGLTGLANRSQLVVRLAALDPVRLLTSALVFVDLDDFKDVNDTHGDAEGDELLRTAAARMRSCIRPGDLLARLGGDEFAVLLEGADVEAAEDLARRAVEAMNVPFTVAGQLCHVSASVGVAIGTVDIANPQVLLRSADLAMYEAKSRGKGRFVRFDVAMSDALTLRTRTESELRQAIEHDELVLHYQPIMDLSSGDMAGVEALVRWQHPVRGLLGPNEFVPLAERTGAIVALGAWVLGTACRQAASWQAARVGQKPLVVSVNVSARQLDEPAFVVNVAQILAETGLDPACLCLEVTETAVMSNPAGVQQAGRALRDLGVQLSIDDFGTGYASLTYLRRLHANDLKIDRSFVDGLGHELDDTTIVTAVIGLAHAMGLSVTAEGVETTEQLRILRDMGCQKAQGFLMCRPVPASQLSPEILSPAGFRSAHAGLLPAA
ncbi:MAG TPA: bifunctional diguanylate cyclase/phosphodiesterase, partial [Acidimicrobiales bacterium]|nr:bifunctional diguanylate cyclase/phosphodiesterase [Acidimicrobiales bacterium]